jgi:biotin carboxyl carrier protein
MPGMVLNLLVKEGDVVEKFQEILTIEAMKMQNLIRSPQAGRILKLFIVKGDVVSGEQALVKFYPQE